MYEYICGAVSKLTPRIWAKYYTRREIKIVERVLRMIFIRKLEITNNGNLINGITKPN